MSEALIVISIVLIVLKVFAALSISWFWALLPLIIYAVATIFGLIVGLIVIVLKG